MLEECVRSVVSSLDEIIDITTSGRLEIINSHVFESEIPSKCLKEPCILGVDEAGRGPVLGPMVYSVFYCSAEDIDILTDIGCIDSKALTEKKREEIFELINDKKDKLGWKVDVISPNLISNYMLKRVKYSLNEIAQNSTINLIESIQREKISVKQIYVDTIGPSDKYQEKLSKIFPQSKVIVEAKADSIYPVVSAASICAKVIRDTIVHYWMFPEKISISDLDMGTGYPGDPKTKTFLMNNKDCVFGFPNCVRFSWSTAAKVLENETSVEWKDESENQATSSGQSKILSYFKKLPTNKAHSTDCNFLKNRYLKSVSSFFDI